MVVYYISNATLCAESNVEMYCLDLNNRINAIVVYGSLHMLLILQTGLLKQFLRLQLSNSYSIMYRFDGRENIRLYAVAVLQQVKCIFILIFSYEW